MNTLCILRLRSISLQNFRSFKDTVKISDLKRVNVLVGPNKAGKSNVFEALSLLKSLANDDANSIRSLDDYRFDHAKQNKIVIEIEIELSPSEQLQVVELLGRSNLFDNLDFENSKLFKHLKYHLEIGDISELGVGSLHITKEEFFVSDNDDNYILLIDHKIANGSANQYYVDLKEVLPSIKSITEFTNIKATKKQTRSVSASILAAGTMPLEYRIGNMMIEFLKKIRLFPPSRRANPFGHAAQIISSRKMAVTQRA
jgi:predicted ATP-dependent endonuclease of OLD family